ncbi:hypothetical protein PHMEG_00022795 [Phytophthora megakarya]|uniref:Uncharacterized protein n=1 Tax=Phytophthora megakarya TaxID=4795 RepID=A0A225VHT1_9STRA|nr:hypothetical protein PHMEG_00022795 [Phytophthora megakarya]
MTNKEVYHLPAEPACITSSNHSTPRSGQHIQGQQTLRLPSGVTPTSGGYFDKFSPENYANSYGQYLGNVNAFGSQNYSPNGQGMPSHIKNAVPTVGLNDALRLSVFRERLKGKPGEEWWMYSHIEDFETLKTRFHNQFIC